MSASAGRVLIIPKGTYNAGTSYDMLDSVFYNGNSYIAKQSTLGNLPTDSTYWQILAQGAGVISGAFAGSSDSLGSAQVKTVIIPPADNFALQKGVIVGVRFTNTNTFEATSENSIALNVNSSGAIPIYFDGTATPLGSSKVAFGEAGYTHFYQYDGTNWVFIGRSGTQSAKDTPLETAISIGGSSKTNAEDALSALNTSKADKVSGATNGNFAGLDSSGNLTDSGKKASDFGTSAEVSAIVNVYGSKNLNSYPYFDTTKSESGITYTDNGDGSVTIGAGTATSTTDFVFHARTIASKNALFLQNGNYKVTGCPEGGSENTFYLSCEITKDGALTNIGKDTGNGVTVEINGDDNNNDKAQFQIRIVILSGTVISSSITFKPMIRDARISDATYEPYAMTNRELTDGIKGYCNINASLKNMIYVTATSISAGANEGLYTNASVTNSKYHIYSAIVRNSDSESAYVIGCYESGTGWKIKLNQNATSGAIINLLFIRR